MKRVLVLSVILFGLTLGGFAQTGKFAYVDSKFILEQLPEYTAAQKQLDDLSDQWQKEIEKMYDEIQIADKKYQEEKIVLPDEMKRKREAEIAKMLEDVREFQKKKFGVSGELFQKRQELIKPIQDRLYQAIQDVAKDRYSMVFDKANQTNLLFADEKLDISDRVLDRLKSK